MSVRPAWGATVTAVWRPYEASAKTNANDQEKQDFLSFLD